MLPTKRCGELDKSCDPQVPEWGNPARATLSPFAESIGKGGERGELKHLSSCRKRKKDSISSVVASEEERA